jgi:N utilization substance protein B
LDKSTIKPIYSKKYQEKRAARVLAVQCMYSYQNNDDVALDQVIYDIIKDSKSQDILDDFSKSDEKILITLVRGANSNIENLKLSISKHLSKEWRFDRLGKVIQAILLVAAYELMTKENDAAVVINEYIEITKLFNHEGESGFINSVLDGIAKDI